MIISRNFEKSGKKTTTKIKTKDLKRKTRKKRKKIYFSFDSNAPELVTASRLEACVKDVSD